MQDRRQDQRVWPPDTGLLTFRDRRGEMRRAVAIAHRDVFWSVQELLAIAVVGFGWPTAHATGESKSMNLDLMGRRCSALSTAVLAGMLLSNQALAQGAYQGKTVTVVVGTDAG